MRKLKLGNKLLASVLALVMIVSSLPVTNAYAAADNENLGQVSVITNTVDADVNDQNPNEIVVTYNNEITLDWDAKNEEIGRNADGWWVGIKMTAPTGMDSTTLENATYKSKASQTSDWSSVKSFWKYKDSEDDMDTHYITLWAYINEKKLNDAINNDYDLITEWQFDWDNDSTYEQAVSVEIDPLLVRLNKDSEIVYPSSNIGSVEVVTSADASTIKNDNPNITTVEYVDDITLDWAQSNTDIGRNVDGWWAGIKITAPAGSDPSALENAKFKSKSATSTTWSDVNSFWDFKDSNDDDSVHYITLWVYVNEQLKESGETLKTKWSFDWNNDDVYEQLVNFYIDTKLVTLDYSERYKLDTKSPEITITNPSGDIAWTKDDITISGIILDAPEEYSSGIKESYYIKENDSEKEKIELNENGEFSFAVNAQEYDGKYIITAIDNSGKKSEKLISVQMDNGSPVLSDITPDTSNWFKDGITVTGKATDEYSGVSKVEYKKDLKGEAWNPVDTLNADGTFSFAINAQEYEGDYIIRCTDNANNNAEKRIPVKMDNVICVVTVTDVDTSAWTNKDVTISGKVSDNTSGVKNVTYKLPDSDEEKSAKVTYPSKDDKKEAEFEIVVSKDEFEGSGDVVITFNDVAGNDCSLNQTIKIDTTAASFEELKLDEYDWTSQQVTISGKVSDNLSGVSKIEIYHGDDNTGKLVETIESFSDGTFSYDVPASSENNGTYAVYCYDNAGNVSHRTVTVNMDTTAPDKVTIEYSESIVEKIISDLTFGFYQEKCEVTLSSYDELSGVKEFNYSYGGNNYSKIFSDEEVKNKQEFKFEIPADFKGSVSATATDKAGNTSDKFEDGKIIVVDNTPSNLNVTYSTEENHDFHFVDVDNETVDIFSTADRAYTNGNVTATITIDEANFFEGEKEGENGDGVVHQVGILLSKISNDDVTETIEYLPKGASKNYSDADKVVEFNWNSTGTSHSLEIEFSEDADYILQIDYPNDFSNNKTVIKDNSSNSVVKGNQYISKQIIVDKTAPVITVSYDNNTVINDNRFKAGRKATITVDEHNFFPADIVSAFTATDINGNEIEVEDYAAKLANIKNWTKAGNVYTIDLEYSVNANYTFSFDYTDKSNNQMVYSYADGVTAPENFAVDTVAPKDLTIEYSESVFNKVLGELTFGFYKGICHVTISAKDDITGVDYFDYSYDLQKDDVHTENVGSSADNVSATVDENDKSVYTCEFDIPAQFRGNVTASATDKAGNKSSTVTNKGIVVTDTITPKMKIKYTAANDEYNGVVYYGSDVTATIEVTEENFMDGEYPDEVKAIEISADIVDENGELKTKKYKVTDWARVGETDVWRGHFTMTDEGDYTLKINYSDMSGNAADEYTYEKTICIDKTSPKVAVSYDNNTAENEKYFDAARKATITVEEHNFFPEDIASIFTATDVNGNEVEVEDYAAKLADIDSWTKSGNTYTIDLEYSVDANYTFSFDYTDKSNNTMVYSYADGTVAPEDFAVDTVSPEITLTTSIPIVHRVLNALTFGIFNPDAKVIITTTDLTAGIDYVTYQSTSIGSSGIGTVDSTTIKSSEMEISADGDAERAVCSFSIPAEFRNTLLAEAFDKSGNSNYTTTISSEEGSYDGIIVDNTSDNDLIKLSVDKSAEYASEDTFATNFNFYVSIEDVNAGIGDVKVYINNISLTEDNEGNPIEELYSADSNENSLIEKIEFAVNTSQINKAAVDGVYTLTVIVTDNAGNEFANSYTAYIDVYAPMVIDFTFDTDGEAYYGDEAYIMGEKVDPVGDNSTYSFYFEEDTKVTVYAYDYDENGLNSHTAGISDIKLIAVNADGTFAIYESIDSSFVQTTDDGIGYSQKTFNIAGPFKGDIYAISSDYAGNYPTDDESNGIVLDSYKPLMSSIYEGYVAPYDVIIENAEKHYNTSSIVIKPNAITTAAENYSFTPSSETIGSKGQLDKNDSDTYNAKNNVPLYSNDVSFTINVSDTYSGIKKIAWKVVGQDDQDIKNNKSGEVKVNNVGGVSGDSDWIKVKKNNNLVTEMSKTITVNNNSNDITIVVELTDRADNISYDYYVLGIDKTKPSIQVTVDGEVHNSKYFNTSRTVEVIVTERNFDKSLVDIVLTNNNNDISFKGSKLKWTDSAADINATDSTTHIATFTISNEGDYSLLLKSKDLAGNDNNSVQYSGSAPTNFVIDKVAPLINVSMTGNSQNKANYFNEDREITVVVTDRNFDNNDVDLVITKDGRSYAQNLVWDIDQSGPNRTNTTKATARFTISDEGDYTFAIGCNDLADNSSAVTSYATNDCEQFTIDKTAPTVTITGVSYMSANNGKKDGDKIDIPLTVTVNDANIGNYYRNNEVDANDLVETLRYSTLNSTDSYNDFVLTQSSRTDAVYTVSNIETDGIYVLNLNIQDCAGNKITSVTYNTDEGKTLQQDITNGATDFFTFSVNRNGSTFSVNSDTQNLIETHYVQNVKNDVVINEINVDELQGELKNNVRITKNGELIDASNYISVEHRENSSLWNNYVYTIDKNCFNDEATYSLSVESKDSAANDGYSELLLDTKINFVVDRTKPVAIITGVTAGTTYFKESQPVSVKITDDVLLSRVVIKLNGEILVDTYSNKNLEDYMSNGQFEWNYEIKSSDDAQNISVECYDAAENSNVDESNAPNGLEVDNFLVSVEFGPRARFWISNNIIPFVLICVTVIAVITCIILLIVYKKKKKQEKEN